MNGLEVRSDIELCSENAELVAAIKCGDRITIYGGTVDMVLVSRDGYSFSTSADYDPDFEVGHMLSFHIIGRVIEVKGE